MELTPGRLYQLKNERALQPNGRFYKAVLFYFEEENKDNKEFKSINWWDIDLRTGDILLYIGKEQMSYYWLFDQKLICSSSILNCDPELFLKEISVEDIMGSCRQM